VAMGIEIPYQFEVILHNKFFYLLFLAVFITSGINDHTFAGFVLENI
jgi:hypothetical protein